MIKAILNIAILSILISCAQKAEEQSNIPKIQDPLPLLLSMIKKSSQSEFESLLKEDQISDKQQIFALLSGKFNFLELIRQKRIDQHIYIFDLLLEDELKEKHVLQLWFECEEKCLISGWTLQKNWVNEYQHFMLPALFAGKSFRGVKKFGKILYLTASEAEQIALKANANHPNFQKVELEISPENQVETNTEDALNFEEEATQAEINAKIIALNKDKKCKNIQDDQGLIQQINTELQSCASLLQPQQQGGRFTYSIQYPTKIELIENTLFNQNLIDCIDPRLKQINFPSADSCELELKLQIKRRIIDPKGKKKLTIRQIKKATKNDIRGPRGKKIND